jgi:hypothetical protein
VRQRLVTERDWPAIAAVAFLAANLVHGIDHQRTGPDRLTVEVKAGGVLVTLTAIATLWLVWRRSPRAPAVAAFVGFWSAALIASAHFAPHWSAFSDSYLDLSPDAFSWFAAAAEVAAALALGLVGVRQLHVDAGPA